MAWSTSTKFRFQAHAMFRHLLKQEKAWKARIDAKVKVYTPEEVVAFAKARGLTPAPSVVSATATAVTAKKSARTRRSGT